MNKLYIKLFLLLAGFIPNVAISQTTLIGGATGNGNFEAAGTWVIANNPNGNTDNRWVISNAAAGAIIAGTKSAYITNNNSASNYSYTTTQSVTQHVYQSVTFPAGQTCIDLSFKWKCNGESSSSDWDNIKVFVSSTLPVGGTANAAADRVGATWYNLQTTTQTANITLPGSLAGTTKYLIFQFKCDGSGGSQSPASIDDVSLITSTPAVPSCASYISPVNGATGLCSSATLSWNTVAATCGNAVSYDVYFDAGLTASTLVSSAQSGTTYATSALSASTTYAWKIVPRNSIGAATGCSTYTFTTGASSSSSVAPFTNNFESCSDWTIVNGAQTNKWVQGAATNNGGTQSMYVTNDGGTSNAYSTGSSSVVHFYKDIAFPAGQTCISLSFDWKNVGESSYDDLKIFSVATSVTPVAGTAMSAANQIGSTYQGQSTWQSVNISLPASYAGTTQRLVFSWRNDGSGGTQPPAAVDNIAITSATVPAPACTTYSLPTNSSTVCPNSVLLSWSTVTASCGSNITYDVYFNAGTSATTLASSSQTSTTFNPGLLSPSTVYAWKIVPLNGTITATGCSTFTFATYSFTSATTAPLTDNFNGSCFDWTTVNGSQTNKWQWGTATGNPSKAIYISNDGGTTNAYSHTSSTVHFYKDITFPAGQECITLSFDWKGQGESTFDYLRVFGISTTVTPVAGTALSSGQIGSSYYNLSGSWATVSLNLPASYAGTTQRIVFSWVNDGSGGTQPPAAVDNIVITTSVPPAPSCATYTAPANGATICPVGTLLAWNTVTATCGTVVYDVYLNAGTNATTLVSSSQSATSYNTGALATGTYAWKIVPRIGSVLATGCSTNTFVVSVVSTSVAPFTNNFESCSDWALVNGSQTNKWYQGSATNNGGTQSMYVTNDNGVTNAYSHTSSTVHFYKDISFPAGQSCITLSFDWKNSGESGYDELKVYTASTGVTPVAGTAMSSSLQIGSTYQGQTTWQTVNIILPSTYAGTTQRIIFSWKNDGSGGTQPPAAVDNIAITTAAPAVPACATYVSPANSSTFCPLPTTLIWNPVTSSCGSIAYDVYLNAGTTATTLVSSSQTSTTYVTPVLSPNTVYAWKIIPRVGTTLATGCSTYTFATNSYTADFVAPLSNTFEGTCNEWTVVNGTQTNKWEWGSATANGGTKSMYISDNGGSSNNYTKTSASIVHFYKDIQFPPGLTCISLSFDWKGQGESTYDYLRVFGVATTITPVAGTALSSGQLGSSYYNLSSSWATVNITLPTSYAGTTQRIVFSWVNDGSTGTQPPAAVDNIIISATTPTAPACPSSAPTPTNGATTACSGIVDLQWGSSPSTGCTTATGYNLYLGTNNPPTNIYNGLAVGNINNYSTPSLASSTIYYWQIRPTNSGGEATGCTTYSFTTGAVLNPANDEPCNAVNIPIGTIASGDNSCSSNGNEPATPGCWSSGSVNTVWFSFVAPATGNVKIRTAPGSLRKTQIAVYTGVCGSGMTYVNCNDNAPSCGSTSLDISELSLTGLTAGATYYIAVDGNSSDIGNFSIAVIEASLTYPNLAGQNCTSPLPVCAVTFTVGNPGYQGIGFTCDDPGDASDNCTSGERGSVWYTFSTTGTGTLQFNIVPNDFDGVSCGPETDYDFVLWKISGSTGVVTSCSDIAIDGGNVSACNFDSYGVTGLAPSGNPPASFPSCYSSAYEPPVSFVAGETFVLLIENYSNSTSGFSIDFGGSTTSAVSFVTPSTVVWAGGASNTDWLNSSNWASCNPPTCSRNAVVSPGSAFQPIITAAMGTVTVQELTIDPGGILTMAPNSVLQICENLTNNGTLLCSPTSTIIFTDDKTTHTLNGTLTGTSKMGNLIIKDISGSTNCTVRANTDIELTGNLQTTSNTSIFDLNGKELTIAGSILNSGGANTFSNTAGSSIIFNGSSAQTYNPNMNSATPSLTLNNVTMNHTGPGVTIATTNTPNMLLGTSGVLTLNNGKIITPNAQEVVVMNTNNSAVTPGNSSSYVEGNLRRYLVANATGPFDFPVGHATPGYELANINFLTAAATSSLNLLARFDPWGGSWPLPSGTGLGTECGNTYSGNYLDHGYWSIDASIASTGTYSMTLYNNGYTNATGGWTIAKSPSSAPAWALNGTCLASLVTAVQRENMSGFSKFGIPQGAAPLPVDLVSFKGESHQGYNDLVWHTASEVNFKQYELESSNDGINFKKIATKLPANSGTSLSTYSYDDYEFYKPITYYRLKVVDLDSKYKYSNTISLEDLTSLDIILSIYPNPATSEVNISLKTPRSEKRALIEMKDVYGRLVFTKEVIINEGLANLYVNTQNYSEGTYIITTHFSDSPSIHQKVIINKK